MIINHNIAALNTHRQLGSNNAQASKNLEKLSSGLQINRAGDDAAGLAISEKMRGQIRGLDMAAKNSQDGISMIQTAEGALNETHSILQRMRELTVQAGNTGTQQDDDLTAIQDEMDSLMEELGGTGKSEGISDRTQFNGKDLLTGAFSVAGPTAGENGAVIADGAQSSLTFQIGANKGQQMSVNIGNMSAVGLGLSDAIDTPGAAGATGIAVSKLDVSAFAGATDAAGKTAFDTQLGLIDTAIKTVSSTRSNLGAVQNRLEHTINNLGTSSENLTAAESRIRDVDYVLTAA